MAGEHTIEFYRDSDTDELRVRVDAPGERAVSAPIDNPLEAVRELCEAADLELDESDLPDWLAIRIPPGN